MIKYQFAFENTTTIHYGLYVLIAAHKANNEFLLAMRNECTSMSDHLALQQLWIHNAFLATNIHNRQLRAMRKNRK
jgi:hypothetical protein